MYSITEIISYVAVTACTLLLISIGVMVVCL